MIKIFLDSAVYIKVFASAFTGLAAMTTTAFYYVGYKYSKNYEQSLLEIYKQKEILNAQERQLSNLREQHIP